MEKVVLQSNLANKAYDFILNKIFTQEYAPGSLIPEKKLSEELSLSRAPVRDAIQRLNKEGLIVLERNKIGRLVEYTQDEIYAFGAQRVYLEALSCKGAYYFGSRSDFNLLYKIGNNRGTAGNYGFDTNIDASFHRVMAQISKSPFLVESYDLMSNRLKYILTFYPKSVDFNMDTTTVHSKIAQQLLNGDLEAALKTDLNHIIDFYGLDEHYPDDFFKF